MGTDVIECPKQAQQSQESQQIVGLESVEAVLFRRSHERPSASDARWSASRRIASK